MKLIKNVHLIQDALPEKELEALDQGAYNYAKHTQLYFKIISYGNNEIIVEARQYKNANDKYFDEREMSERTRGLFERYFPGHDLKVRLSPYKSPEVDIVTPEWLHKNISKRRISRKQISLLTGIDQGNISNWISGNRPMSQPVKAMFYYLIKSMDK